MRHTLATGTLRVRECPITDFVQPLTARIDLGSEAVVPVDSPPLTGRNLSVSYAIIGRTCIRCVPLKECHGRQ